MLLPVERGAVVLAVDHPEQPVAEEDGHHELRCTGTLVGHVARIGGGVGDAFGAPVSHHIAHNAIAQPEHLLHTIEVVEIFFNLLLIQVGITIWI